ncbi:hypothetical protein [Candidatus Mesenet endosymbiont of Agriotes lineatus]|uniref:hypothetical protein n=1 Tax=Candidatus Mesenet endosymbiont of Agriotes lineatus TaxID=3077948 RepID=UPI0030CE72CE
MLIMFFKNFKHKNKLVILLGEEGAVLLHIKNNILTNRCFLQDAGEFTDLKLCVTSDKKIHIYLVLNHVDQDYTVQSIPAVDRFSIYSIVKSKLRHIPTNSDLKTAFLLSKPSKSEKNWQYMFVSVRLNNAINSWLKLIIDAGGNFKGMLMLPIEMASILNAILTPKEVESDGNNWSIIVVYTKTGGFRQLVTKDSRMIFTRIISPTDDILPNVIAGSVYQEVQNTIQYLGRFGFHKNDSVDLHIVVPQDIKLGLMTIKFAEYNVSILTPYELSKILKLTHIVNPNDRFCDTVLLLSILENKPKVVLHTRETKKHLKLMLFDMYFPHLSSLTLLLLFTINTLFFLTFIQVIKKKNNLIQDEKMLNAQLQNLNRDYSIERIYEISEIINAHNELLSLNYSPLSEIEYISEIKSDNLELRSFYWKVDNETDAVNMKLKYCLKSDSDIFYEYEDLKHNFNTIFYNYKVDFSQLPPVIELGGKGTMIDVNISK